MQAINWINQFFGTGAVRLQTLVHLNILEFHIYILIRENRVSVTQSPYCWNSTANTKCNCFLKLLIA